MLTFKKSAETIVLSLGGSLIVPKEIDVKFLKQFKNFILRHKDKKFIIVCGGGYTNTLYNQAAKKLSEVSNDDLDWIGIKATRLNAELVRTMFSNIAYNGFVEPDQKVKTDKRVIVCGGWKPGNSSDFVAVLLAQSFDAGLIINMTNVDYVYDKDPKKYKDAKMLKNLSWKEYKKIIGGKWQPRSHTPFDPIASRLAEKLKFKVAILNGRNLNNLDKFLQGKEFVGTTLE